jgi:hypothetical protein
VKYNVHIIIDKPWYKSNTIQIYPLIIFPNVDLFQVPEGRQSVAESCQNQDYLQLKVYLHHRGILSGQKISLDIDIENPKRLEIKKIEAILIQHRKIAQNHHAEIIFRIDLPDLLNFNETELHQTFDLQVPYDYLSPTYNYKTQYCNSSISADIYYELKLEAKVVGMLIGMNFNIPIIIGTESSLERHQYQRNGYIEMPVAYIADLEETDLPPSYQSVIENQKSQKLMILP